MQLKALLLDLDGTLIDTAPDMVGTLNRVLVLHDEQTVDLYAASKLVSQGAKALLEFGFSSQLEDNKLQQLYSEFLSTYADHVADQSRPYAGMLDVLETCTNNNIRWGVVTNKPLALSRALLDQLGLLTDCSILLGGDSLPVKKPDPAPLLHCCMTLNLAASECLYVGDHERDIIAGKRAGMDTAAALWGYIDNSEDADSWGANYLIKQPQGLHTLVTERIQQRNNANAAKSA